MKNKPGIMILFAAMTLISYAANCQSVQLTRKYRVIAVKNGNPSITSMSNETEVIPSMFIYVPNSFTPNGDGLNDTFGIRGEAVQNFSIQIFNRWGDLIYESTDATSSWDGTYKGQNAPQGVYVYKVSASSISGRKAQKEGTLSLIL